MVDSDVIAEIGIDEKGRLYVAPEAEVFPFIYREAMEIQWDEHGRYLFAPPPPRAQLESHIWWFRRILEAAKGQGCELHISQATKWKGIPPTLREEISHG